MAAYDRQLVHQMLLEAIGEFDLFVVELTVSDSVQPKITVTLDGPNGLGIDECAKVSRGRWGRRG